MRWEERRRQLRQTGQMSCGYCWARQGVCSEGPCPPTEPTFPQFLGLFPVRDAVAISQARRDVTAPVMFSDEFFSDQPLFAALYATGPGDLQPFWIRVYATLVR